MGEDDFNVLKLFQTYRVSQQTCFLQQPYPSTCIVTPSLAPLLHQLTLFVTHTVHICTTTERGASYPHPNFGSVIP